jgi:hypothetical protein
MGSCLLVIHDEKGVDRQGGGNIIPRFILKVMIDKDLGKIAE